MTRCAIPPRSSPAPSRRRSSNASLGANELDNTCAASARALAMQARRHGSLGCAVPVSTGFRCTPTRRCQRIGEINWHSSSAIQPVALERLVQDTNGDLVYTCTHPRSDGTPGIRLSPLELLEKLAALVPLHHV